MPTSLARSVRALVLTILLACSTARAVDTALLVGVSTYPGIGRRLDGPANDVRLMRSALEHMGLDASRIEVLADGEGHEGPLSARPTRANILLALQRLAMRAEPGSWAVVYFSGHGTQVPQTLANRARYREPDGLDSVFLPHNVARWNPKTREVEGAISDDQMGLALRKIAQRGVKVWAVFDTCHAGDMTRGPASDGGPVSISRHLPPQVLGVPLPALLKPTALRSPAAIAPVAHPNAGNTNARLTPVGSEGWIASYAAQRDETASEEMFPDPLVPGSTKRFGVFTYHLAQQARKRPASFAELAQAVQHEFRARPFPTPYFEGALHLALPAGR
jgi:Caspase domain